VHIDEEPVDAIEHALALAGPEDLICATGSFHVAGPIRAHLTAASSDRAGQAASGGPRARAG
jgi:hypothetical protein